METKSSFKPVADQERIKVLDALRGFAIFGILIINIGVFSGYSYMTVDARSQLLAADWNSTFDWFHSVFFSGKFYTLFSLLFGIGFAIQFIRVAQANRPFKRHFSRRLFILLLIGIVHLWGIWFSDILVIYAICGYILIFFERLSNKASLWAAFFVMLIPGLHSWYLHSADNSYTNIVYEKFSETWTEVGLPKASDEYYTFQMPDVVEVIQSDSLNTVLTFNYIGPMLRGYIFLLDARMFKVLAIFIIGLWAGRKLMSDKLHQNNSLLVRFAIAGFIIGLPLNLFDSMNVSAGSNSAWLIIAKDGLSPFGNLALTAGYSASFMLIFQSPLRRIMTKFFSAVGKTALTNYILQSIISIFLFYEIGLGLGKYFGSAYLTLSVIIIFLFQVLLSILWLKRYKYGPLEWLWRMLTYGSYIKNRKNKTVTPAV
ncbi:MAG: DUF418 domain-containing protein [Ignavibacteriaceae bacterium]